MDKHWEKYMLEEYGRSIISNDKGFISYCIHDKECVIYDLFIDTKFRNSREGINLCTQVFSIAKSKECEFASCLVDLDDSLKGTKLCKTYIEYGFNITRVINNQLVMVKEL